MWPLAGDLWLRKNEGLVASKASDLWVDPSSKMTAYCYLAAVRLIALSVIPIKTERIPTIPKSTTMNAYPMANAREA